MRFWGPLTLFVLLYGKKGWGFRKFTDDVTALPSFGRG
ncbi:Putative protein [Zobellia galactanivorans]|uniref:Uncharacterized protein n=1 Tax=Zobellia galactanivorans (strain DSM 12802 / CCUG 47099 / CIP 106680 / NCIMB 13871 / Dsij) TaxID=63186 RepID=G0L6F5_ZOBGA|nr:Putative protein [Zobellia galactanivorans]